MNGLTHSDAQLRQRHKETGSHNSGSNEIVTESGKIEIGFYSFQLICNFDLIVRYRGGKKNNELVGGTL